MKAFIFFLYIHLITAENMAKASSVIMPAGIQISRESAVPLYMQLYQQIKELIASKQLRPGNRIPSSRVLAAELNVSRVIVSQCFEYLIIEGYLEGKTGSGTFVAQVQPEQLLQVNTSSANNPPALKTTPPPAEKKSGSRIIAQPFQIGMPSLDRFPYHTWQKIGNHVLRDLKKYHLGYEDTLGLWELRKEIAVYLRLARGVTCEAAQVMVVTGSQQGLNLVVQALLQPRDKAWMEDPGYHGARLAFKHAHITACPVPVQEDGLDVSYAMEHYPDAKLAYVTPSHQFPTGYTLSAEKKKLLLEWAATNNSWILEDDYDSEYRYEGMPLPCLQGADNAGRVIYAGTFSKVLFPGLRLAYLVLPSAELVSKFKKIKENTDRQSPAMEQYLLYHFMEGGHFLRHIRKMRLLYAERQQLLIQLVLTKLSDYLEVHNTPSGMHLLCWLKEGIDITKLKQEIKSQALSVSFVENFTTTHHLPPAILLGFTAYSGYKLKTGIEKLATCLQRATQ